MYRNSKHRKVILLAGGLLACLLLTGLDLRAQQMPLLRHYIYGDYFTNPSAIANKDFSYAFMNFRTQWTGFENAPNTQLFGMNSKIKDNFFIGGTIFRDKVGPISNTGIKVNYAYRLRLKDNSSLNFGISSSFYQYYIRKSELVTLEDDDAAIIALNENSMDVDFAYGMSYLFGNAQVGFSLPYLYYKSFKNGDAVRLENHYTAYATNVFDVGKSFKYKPYLFVRAINAGVVQLDVVNTVIYRNTLEFGLGFSPGQDMTALIAINTGNIWIGYTYDYAFSILQSYSSGSHELSLAFPLEKERRDLKEHMRALTSSSAEADGVENLVAAPVAGEKESKDGAGEEKETGDINAGESKEVPVSNENTTYNITINNYGPGMQPSANRERKEEDKKKDSDNDGINDFFDDCPHTSGLAENAGCPIPSSNETKAVNTAIENLEFDLGTSNIKSSSLSALDKLSSLLNSKADWKIRLMGHTDDLGSEMVNLKMSRQRAEAVRDQLLKKGVAAEKIFVEYYGEFRPINDNTTEEGRLKNRRAEMEFIFD